MASIRPPQIIGEFQIVSRQDYEKLLRKLEDFLPQSRRIVETLRLEIIGINTMAYFYVPTDEIEITTSTNFSGCAMAIFGEWADPLSGFYVISSQQDVKKVQPETVLSVKPIQQ